MAAEPETETIYTNPITAEMARRRAHLESLPGYHLKVDLEALSRCSYTFSRNAQELTNQPIDLIDGDRPCELLKANSLGVTTTTRTVKDLTIE